MQQKTELGYAKADEPTDPKLKRFRWRTSSLCGDCEECVEVGACDNTVAVRDTKDRTRGMLAVSPQSWQRFVRNLDTLH